MHGQRLCVRNGAAAHAQSARALGSRDVDCAARDPSSTAIETSKQSSAALIAAFGRSLAKTPAQSNSVDWVRACVGHQLAHAGLLVLENQRNESRARVVLFRECARELDTGVDVELLVGVGEVRLNGFRGDE